MFLQRPGGALEPPLGAMFAWRNDHLAKQGKTANRSMASYCGY
jgi:hypothetical protein